MRRKTLARTTGSRPSPQHTIQKAIESVVKEATAPAALLALLFEIKLRKARVRLTIDERRKLRQAARTYWKTKDESVLAQAVQRKRRITIHFGERDLSLLDRIVTGAVEGTITSTIATIAISMEPEVRAQAMRYAAWHEATILRFREGPVRRWRTPLQRFAEFRHVAAHVGELSVARFKDKGSLETSRLANALKS